jgi:predicted nucleic acid-binding protein
MRLFLDANLLVTLLNKEYPLFPYAARIVSLVDDPKYKVYTSPVCLAIAFYFAEKKSGRAKAREKISLLVEKILITTLDKEAVTKAVRNPAILDFEDGLEYYSAESVKAECIITEDRDDFFFSDIEVLDSRSFLDKYFQDNKLGIPPSPLRQLRASA